MALDRFFEWLENRQVPLNAEQQSQFERFQSRLYQANQSMNLTRVPMEESWWRHFADSLLFHDRFGPDSSILDIGTGPGFPAWPLACARPDLKVTAIDANGKMVGFLESNPLPNLTVIQTRIEDWKVRNKFDYVTGRAVAPLNLQLELSVAPCKLHGKICPMRTPNDDLEPFELGTLGLRLGEVETRTLPEGGGERLMPSYLKFRPTEGKYPRRWAEMKANPLRRP